jgi:hypothetical protein
VTKGGDPEAFIPGFPTHERALDEIARLRAVDAEQEQHKKRNA